MSDELEAIVRDLAALTPKDLPGVDTICSQCGTWFEGEQKAAKPSNHAESCAWRRAVEFVAAHPVSGTETTDGP